MTVDMNEYYKQQQINQLMMAVDALRRDVASLKDRLVVLESSENKKIEPEPVTVTLEKKKPGRPPKSEE